MARLEIYVHAREAPITLEATSAAGARVLAQYSKKLAGEEAQDTFRIALEDGGLARFVLDLDNVVGIMLVEPEGAE